MKNIIFGLLFAMFLSTFASAQSPVIEHLNNLGLGKDLNTSKQTVILITANSCKYCKKLKDKTLSTAAVKKKLKEFNFVTMDIGNVIEELYTFSAPTLFFINKDGTVAGQSVGFIDKEELLEILN